MKNQFQKRWERQKKTETKNKKNKQNMSEQQKSEEPQAPATAAPATVPLPAPPTCGGKRCCSSARKRPRVAASAKKPRKLPGPQNILGQWVVVPCYSAFLGEVKVPGLDLGRGNIALLYPVQGGPQTIYIKCIDTQLNRLDVLNKDYRPQDLEQLYPTVVNIDDCKRQWQIISSLRAKPAQSLTKQEQTTLARALAHNQCVDIQFAAAEFVRFLHERVNIPNIVDRNHLLLLHNVPGYDNAFFSGKYMVFGNGKTQFYAMGTADICGHELGHGVVQRQVGNGVGLVYVAHPGALNESFADVLACAFEFYLYEKNVGLVGQPDFLMGEDNGRRVAFLRNLQDPTNASWPQPKQYRGQYWGNPNDTANDEGYVHTNSGPSNWLFYLLAQKFGLTRALQIYLTALPLLKPYATYIDLRDSLKKSVTPAELPGLQESLNMVGLTDAATSDWTPPAA